MDSNISWLCQLKKDVPLFLKKIKGKKRAGFYHYSLSGDYFGESIKWGLGNSVFFLKIIFTLGIERGLQKEIRQAANFIKSFQKKDGSFYDSLVKYLSFPSRVKQVLKTLNLRNFSYKKTKRAETRQAFSSLFLYGIRSKYKYQDYPKTKEEIISYLSRLNWNFPWGAGSHFSHLLFFLSHSELQNKQELIESAIDWVNKLQHSKDGFWYKGSPSIQEKINGAMKIITGLKVVNRVNFKYPEKIIDYALLASNNRQACDNFNITYVLKYSNEVARGLYRYNDIKNFMYKRLEIYRNYYYPKIGGFSFNLGKAGQYYYGAPISRGKNEPDIHGTAMFLWGISIISQFLGINKQLKFKEFIT